MVRLTKDLLDTKLEYVKEEDFKTAFQHAVQVKEWIKNQSAYAVASNQVGIPHRFFVVKKPKQSGFPTDIFINPVFRPEPGPDGMVDKIPFREKCLSYPGREFLVLRWQRIRMFYYDYRTKGICEIVLDSLPAIIAQHEISHNEGISDEKILDIQKEEMDKYLKLVQEKAEQQEADFKKMGEEVNAKEPDILLPNYMKKEK